MKNMVKSNSLVLFGFLLLHSFFLSAFAGVAEKGEEEITWYFNKIKLIGPKANVLRATSEMDAIYQTRLGEKLLNQMASKKFEFQFRDWQPDNQRYKEQAHTRHGVFLEPNSWNDKKLNFILTFDPNDQGRLLDFEHPHTEEPLGKIDFTTALFRQILKSQLLLETISFNFSENNLTAETLRFREEHESLKRVTKTMPDYPFITLEGEPEKIALLEKRLQLILSQPVGRQLFKTISSCKNKLRIFDDKSALQGAGHAASERATHDVYVPGKGADAYIRMRMDIPESGSHMVVDENGALIPFTAVENLFHELSHAKHLMCGTFSKRDEEAEAVKDENALRKALNPSSTLRDPSQMDDDKQVWFGL